jgi:flagellar export protein FliJ
MAFRFTLAPLFRLRASYERLERLRLLLIAAIIARVTEEIAGLDRASKETQRQLVAGLSQAGLPAAEIQFHASCEAGRIARRRMLGRELQELRKRQSQQRLAYQTAMRRRQIIENLRNRKYAEYLRLASRREQNAADDLFLLRRYAASREPAS